MEYLEEPYVTEFGSFKVGHVRREGSEQSWHLVGPAGAVNFVTSTLPVSIEFHLPLVQKIGDETWLAMWLGYHSPYPMSESHKKGGCNVLEGGTCYSGCFDERAAELLAFWAKTDRSNNVIWAYLAQFYKIMFLTRQEG